MLSIQRLTVKTIKICGRRKLNQRASLLLLQKLEELRTTAFDLLVPGVFESSYGVLSLQWKVVNNRPFRGVKKLRARVVYKRTKQSIAESIFYRSNVN